MDQKKIIGMLEQAGRHRYFKVVAEKGGNCCDACRALDGKTRRDDDEPVLPVHPPSPDSHRRKNTSPI